MTATSAERSRVFRARHLEAEQARARRYVAQLRRRVFAHYGQACACCKATADLTIDHIDGNGAEHRAALLGDPRRAGHPFYAWLVREDFPAGYQTLCRRCDASKARAAHCRLDHASERRAA